MATRAELMREIKRLRGVAESQFSRIDTAIQKGRLPKSAKGTYFYQEYEQRRRVGTSDVNRKLTGKDVHIKNADLEKIVLSLTKLVEQETASQSGVRKRLNELAKNAETQLRIAGLTQDQINDMTRYQRSKFFQLANMIMEELAFESDKAFETVASTMNFADKTTTELYNLYVKDEKFFQLVKTIKEELNYKTDAAFKAVVETMKLSGLKANKLYREYVKDKKAFFKKYKL